MIADRQVTDITPIGAADGRDGYRLTTERPGAWFAKARRTFTARGVVIAAGALGTNHLLLKCKSQGSLPRLSDRLGELVRTNSESILAITLPDDSSRPWNDVAISASVHPNEDTHIEFCTYGERGDFMSVLLAPLTYAALILAVDLVNFVVRMPNLATPVLDAIDSESGASSESTTDEESPDACDAAIGSPNEASTRMAMSVSSRSDDD